MRTTLTTLAGVAVITLLTAFAPAASATPPAGPPATAACLGGAPACLKVAADAPSGMLTAKDLQEAYRLPSGRLGGGQTVAVVVPYGHTTAEADLAVYREDNGLPPCDKDFPCFRGIDQRGSDTTPPSSPNWGVHAAVGLDLASAACPNCKLLLVQADDETFDNMAAAVDQAAAQGANAVAVMWGVPEYEGQAAQAAHFAHPKVAITAPSGAGFNTTGRQLLPAAYANVVAVGGTELYRDPSTTRGWNESAWMSTGSGCSLYELRPSWQRQGACGSRRTVADVSAVASDKTPIRIYSGATSGWGGVSGVPVAAAFIAGVHGLAGTDSATPAAKRLYSGSRYLFDITAGANGACNGSNLCAAVRGYDGPTGVGTPNGAGAF